MNIKISKSTVLLIVLLGIFLLYLLKTFISAHQKNDDIYNIFATQANVHEAKIVNKCASIKPEDTVNGFPKLVHRIYYPWNIQSKLSKEWKFNAYKSCQENSTGFKLTVWNKTMILHLINTHYPWFINTFNSYKHETQRSDAARYLILHRYGGIYLDMDVRCDVNIKTFLQFVSSDYLPSVELITHKDKWGSIPTNIVISKPCSRFFAFAITQMEYYKSGYFLTFLNIWAGTGPMFLYFRFNEFLEKYSIVNSRNYMETFSKKIFTSYMTDHAGEHYSWFEWHTIFILKFFMFMCDMIEHIYLSIVILILLIVIISCAVLKYKTKTSANLLPRKSFSAYGME